MIRGFYTALSGMHAQERSLEAISNNLANANTVGYKNDTAIFKSFPEMLLERQNELITKLPPSNRFPYFGSSDLAPVVGKLGTGVEVNEMFTSFTQGAFKQTDSTFDFALEGDGFFTVKTPQGERYTRNGSFILGQEGLLMNKDGYPVLDEDSKFIYVKKNNFVVDKDGRIQINAEYGEDKTKLVPSEGNEWEDTKEIGRLKIVTVKRPRYLKKEGSSLYNVTDYSGLAEVIQKDRPKVIQGFLEFSNVNPVNEMTRMISVNRAYEANSKTLKSQDEALGKLINDYMKM